MTICDPGFERAISGMALYHLFEGAVAALREKLK